MRPTQIIVIGFAAVILTGALLLTLPFASESGRSTPFLTCLFTAVSATCVTGLVAVDTALQWSFFGEFVVILLIQIGGLGLMTMAVMLLMILKRNITARERMIIAHSYNLSKFDGIVRLTRRILIGTFIFEGTGTALLSIRFIPMFGFWNGLWKSIFHSVSAFCNAGFDIMGSDYGPFANLMPFSGDWLVCITIMMLIIIGGIGFLVWNDFLNFFKTRKRLSAYTKLVVLVTAILIFSGAFFIGLFEWNNPGTIGNMPVNQKILCSLFQSVTPRTAGFQTIDLVSMHQITQLILIMLMFIGGASASTAGGIKVGTLGLVIYTVFNFARGRRNVTIFKRSIDDTTVLQAFVVTVIQFIAALVGGLLVITTGVRALDAFFEVFSAIGTVGLSLSLTPTLDAAAKIVLMCLMYFGRVGILTFTYAVILRISSDKDRIKHAEAQLLIG